MLVDDLSNLGIVVGFAVHYVAPVAPDRADVQQDRFVLALRNGKGFLAPFVPLNGLMHSGAQVGGRRLGEGVERLGGHGLSVSRWETFMKLVARTTRRALQVESFAQPG